MDCGLILIKFEGFFAKRLGIARSEPSACAIGRPGLRDDVAHPALVFGRIAGSAFVF